MQQSVIYQEWREEFLQEGKERGERASQFKSNGVAE